MLYRFTKRIHMAASITGMFLWYFAAGTSDRCLDFRQAEPENLDSLIAWGFILMIPTVIYKLLEYIRGKKNAIHRRSDC